MFKLDSRIASAIQFGLIEARIRSNRLLLGSFASLLPNCYLVNLQLQCQKVDSNFHA